MPTTKKRPAKKKKKPAQAPKKKPAVEKIGGTGGPPPGLQVERLPIDQLVLDPINANLHPQRNIEAIKGSLTQFGQQKPIVCTVDNVVSAGNGTLVAARALGWSHLDVVRTKLTGAQLIAYGIADNKTAQLAEWDYETLSNILRAIKADEGEGAELLAATGFEDFEIEPMLAAEWKPPEIDDLPEAADGEDEDGKHVLGFMDEQWEIVFSAIKKLRSAENMEDPAMITSSRAVELICADWLAGK